YEGQAAVELEWLATEVEEGGTYPLPLDGTNVDTRPLIAAVAADVTRSVPTAVVARRFHAALADAVARVCSRIRDDTGLNAVALSGGVFLNALLTRDVEAALGAEGFRVYRHRSVPPNDGGLCLGQLAVAAAQEI
ncbi:MAG TPA: carbamoyltransferase HypF, partial [Planctomycetota bacterium]|nr:carbamoyltransferase HypF [Planctomycetota bacterium]